jgi:DNA-binding IclR family transcriptional regulator
MKLQNAMKEAEQQIYVALDLAPEGLTLCQLNSRLGVSQEGPKYWFNQTVLNNMERRGFVSHDRLNRRYFIGRRATILR